ncbi:SDR family NAD(P)-dependent oxidoreductase [Hymenobacter terrenus]|uniref:SDR family NAD(P)-dependent oxidoreductase n=1 Tax=Hymenobacter terrenus TaxID=1629124 RepID=UPI00061960E9|nr:SDR family oxidoreductase [Hymenobacter terrenus]
MTTSKIALVTGGSRGIGKDIALSLAKKGTDVLLTYHTQQADAAATVAEIEALGRKAVALQLNAAAVSSFDAFYAQVTTALQSTFGVAHFDFLINNAGTSLLAPIAENTEAQFDEMLNIHLKGVYFLTQKALPILNNGGRIINISSGVTRYSYPGCSAYGIMKGAVDVFTRYLALELGARGIAANVVAPGAIFGGGALQDTPEMRAYVTQITALGRVGLPDDVGGVVAFLCSEEAKWINGQRIELTGGMNL